LKVPWSVGVEFVSAEKIPVACVNPVLKVPARVRTTGIAAAAGTVISQLQRISMLLLLESKT
jgi:hypothetical protein